FFLFLFVLVFSVFLFFVVFFFFFFKQKTAYELVGSDWSSDVCSSDLCGRWQTQGAWMFCSPPEERASGRGTIPPRRRRRLLTGLCRESPNRCAARGWSI